MTSHPHETSKNHTLDPISELTTVSNLLHLTHHHNHNQHRTTRWYKSFSQLRRHVRKLIPELRALATAESYSSSSSAAMSIENKYVLAARKKVDERVDFMKEFLMERCFVAFGNLTADNQYAVLGLLLIGILARVRSVLLVLGPEEVVEVEKGKEELEMEMGGQAQFKEKNVLRMGEDNKDDVDLDLGELVTREELIYHHDCEDENMEGKDGTSSERQLEKRKQESVMSPLMETPKKKKRKKKGDAFDALFDSLI